MLHNYISNEQSSVACGFPDVWSNIASCRHCCGDVMIIINTAGSVRRSLGLLDDNIELSMSV